VVARWQHGAFDRSQSFAEMNFDLPTLMAAGSFVTAMSSLLILFAWFAWFVDREASGMLWWFGGGLCVSLGIALLIATTLSSSAGIVLPAIGGTFLAIGFALIWSAARLLNNRRVIPLLILAGPAIGALLPALPGFRSWADLPQGLSLLIGATYCFSSAFEFWRDGSDRLRARPPLIGLFLLHGTMFAIGSEETLRGSLPFGAPPPLTSWFGLIHFEALIFAMGTAIFVVAFTREKSERRHKTAAHQDALSGLASRPAFIEYAGARLKECLEQDAPLALIFFDLDRFKLINDTYGHAIGDQALRAFGTVARGLVRSDDFVGRIGGEEFAMILPGSSVGTAYVLAERLRVTFAEAGRHIAGQPTNVTVSAGIATAHRDSTLDSLFETADAALYRAKTQGRNRVEIADERRPNRHGDDSSTVIRVA
jgi:diguanylate cyclase (GGDEF)-like protein